MRGLNQIENIEGKRILLRVDFNLPIKNGVVEDDFRVKKALPTINFLKEKGAKIILITHLGKGGDSLLPVAKTVNNFTKVNFVPDIVGEGAERAVQNMKNGDVVLLENLRNDQGEQEPSDVFARGLAKLGDIYVNEAFPVSHRGDASIILLPKLLPSYAGFQLEEEVGNLSAAFRSPEHPFLFILGGSKFSTKLPLIEKYLDLADNVFVGGALLNDVLKAKGYEVGQSLVDDKPHNMKKILDNQKLIMPEDVVVQVGNKLLNKKANNVQKDETIMDVGDETIKKLIPYIQNAKLILWNGPVGKYEVGGEKGTKRMLKLVADAKAKSIIGGGDTVALISEMQLERNFSFISTGGGATLDFLANNTLPGIQALE
jgi:phosphoglycerate kinase